MKCMHCTHEDPSVTESDRCTDCHSTLCPPCRGVQWASPQTICAKTVAPIYRKTVDGYSDYPARWAPAVKTLMNDIMTTHAIRIRPIGFTEYRSYRAPVRDMYARIGKHYRCFREYTAPGEESPTEFEVKMCLTEEQKESIAAASMHPSRLQKWLDRGWEDDWDDYFS